MEQLREFHTTYCFSFPNAVWSSASGGFGIVVSDTVLTLYGHSNGPRETVIGTLAVDGWLLHLVQRGGAWAVWSTIIASEF